MEENAFNDLSTRTGIFRSKLIEEFQLLDSLPDAGNVQAPVYNTKDIADNAIFQKLLRDVPNQLIKFQIFKRQANEGNSRTDRRLTRLRNLNFVPIGAWAKWLVDSDHYQTLMLVLICVNSILIGVQTELGDSPRQFYQVIYWLNVFDSFALVMFSLEICLKWVDDWQGFWKDGWNVFDFFITLLSALPVIIELSPAALDHRSGIYKTAKTLRAFRVLRTFKMVVRFGSLRIIVLTILQAFQSMAVFMLLLSIMSYIFAIIAISIFDSYTKSKRTDLDYHNSFSSLPRTLATIFQLLTFDHWWAIWHDVSKVINPGLTAIFILSWVWVGGFIMKNIFVGVMVNNFSNISNMLQQQQQTVQKQRQMDKMRRRLNKELERQDLKRHASRFNLGVADEAAVNAELNRDIPHDPNDNTNGASKDANQPEITPINVPDGAADGFVGQGGAGGAPPAIAVESDHSIGGRAPGLDILDASVSRPNLLRRASAASAHDVRRRMSELMMETQDDAIGWEATVAENLASLAANRNETMWPRDTLFKYYQLMETLQENMKEYQELQTLASLALLELHDS